MNIYSYTPHTIPGPNGYTIRLKQPDDPAQPNAIELITLNDRRYVGVPSVTTMPAQPTEIDWRAEPDPPPEVFNSRWHQVALLPMLAHLATIRWQHETAGFTWQNLPIATDRDSQSKMTAAMVGIIAGIRADGAQWKFADNIARPLTNAEFQAMATAASVHVQACFDHEATLAAQLRDGQTPDITTGWPE